MEDNSLYWWKVYVLIGATVIMLLVHLNKEKTKDNSLNYAVSYVSKGKLLAAKEVKKTVVEVKEVTASKADENHSVNKEGKAKVLAAYLKTRRIGRGITNSRVIISESKTDSLPQHSTNNNKEEMVQAETKVSRGAVTEKNSKFISQNNLSVGSTADYKVSDPERRQELINSNDITINQSFKGNIGVENVSGSQSITSLLNTYNKYQSIRNSTISYTVDGSLEFVDITSTDLISNQVPDNTNSPLASKPMGAKNADEDPLNGGGGTDNGAVYNDSGGGPSLPIGDGTSFLFFLSFIFIFIKNIKYNYKTIN